MFIFFKYYTHRILVNSLLFRILIKQSRFLRNLLNFRTAVQDHLKLKIWDMRYCSVIMTVSYRLWNFRAHIPQTYTHATIVRHTVEPY